MFPLALQYTALYKIKPQQGIPGAWEGGRGVLASRTRVAAAQTAALVGFPQAAALGEIPLKTPENIPKIPQKTFHAFAIRQRLGGS